VGAGYVCGIGAGDRLYLFSGGVLLLGASWVGALGRAAAVRRGAGLAGTGGVKAYSAGLGMRGRWGLCCYGFSFFFFFLNRAGGGDGVDRG
jgi:hypothetical protein